MQRTSFATGVVRHPHSSVYGMVYGTPRGIVSLCVHVHVHIFLPTVIYIYRVLVSHSDLLINSQEMLTGTHSIHSCEIVRDV